MGNKKIKNATPKEYNGIQFKSITEVMIYKTLLQYGFEPHYEPTKYPIWRGFKPEVPFYVPDKNGGLKANTTKVQDITYTPDIIFIAPDKKTVIIFEVKGFKPFRARNSFFLPIICASKLESFTKPIHYCFVRCCLFFVDLGNRYPCLLVGISFISVAFLLVTVLECSKNHFLYFRGLMLWFLLFSNSPR